VQAKKDWCCLHEGKGCTGPPVAAKYEEPADQRRHEFRVWHGRAAAGLTTLLGMAGFGVVIFVVRIRAQSAGTARRTSRQAFCLLTGRTVPSAYEDLRNLE